MKHLRGNILYISLSPYLIENAQQTYYAHNYENDHQEVDFLSFREYLEGLRVPQGKELTFRSFAGWYMRYKQTAKIREEHKLFEEFKGVLTGSPVDVPYLSREQYRSLGVKQSIFLKEERDRVYDVFEKYIQWLNEGQYYDTNITAFGHLSLASPQYDFIVVDEVQDFTNVQLMLILKALASPTHFILSGDANQIVHPNFFSWSQLKTLFFQSDLKGSLLRILHTNYRNSQAVTALSNTLLKIKHARFGSIDKESTYLIDTVSETAGEINFLPNKDAIKRDLDDKTQLSTRFAVLVMTEEDKAMVRKTFRTPLVFTIQEAKGLEYENIILVNFVSRYAAEFREICQGVSKAELEGDELRYARARDKENKELEAYKFYINSLYVAFTRAVKNLYLIEENQKQDLFLLLGLVEVQSKVKLEKQSSDNEEWLAEALRLESQGKLEQAEQIRARLMGYEYLGPDEVAALTERVLSGGTASAADLKRLFDYAVKRQLYPLVGRLHSIGYGSAKQYMGELSKAQVQMVTDIRNGNLRGIERVVQKYGLSLVAGAEGMTMLMYALLYNKSGIIDYLIGKHAAIDRPDARGRLPFHIAILGFDRETIPARDFVRYYRRFMPTSIRCRVGDRVVKLGSHSMTFFLVNLLLALRDEFIDPRDPHTLKGLSMDEFVELIEEMPDPILPDCPHKRNYINQILANNEVDRDFRYNHKLFKRVARGAYNLNPDLQIIYD
ncbi:MAG: hypothetical protein OHK0039_15020 [Bacteroidia bacterium]